ncbi:hypothetical protein [Paenibacillus sp. Z6-24]
MIIADDKTNLLNKQLIRAQQSDGFRPLAASGLNGSKTDKYISCTLPDALLTETEVYQVISFIEHHQRRLLHYRKQHDQLKQYSKKLLHEMPRVYYSTPIQ